MRITTRCATARTRAIAVVGGVAALTAGVVAFLAPIAPGASGATTIPLKDGRLKFEVNATDRDAGIQLFVDADEWKDVSLFDPTGARILYTTATGSVGQQGGTELFMESAEPTLKEFSLSRLFKRFPAGDYRIVATGLAGEEIVGSATLTHAIPKGPRLIAPLASAGPQDPDAVTVRWQRVPAPAGSAIIGYQVLVVRPDTGMRALPKVTLDVMMPPTATALRVPPGFLQPGVEYEWEVLAIERGGNQTLSSSTFRTSR